MTNTATQKNAMYSSATDDWPTPVGFYQRLDDEFGFVLDVCSSTDNAKAPTFYALDHEDTTRRDGLSRDWADDTLHAMLNDADGRSAVWMNPPYGRPIPAWMTKARETAAAGATVVCLVPVRSCTRWWHDQVLESGAEVRFVKGRLTFGSATTPAPFSSAVVIFRPSDVAGQPGPCGVMTAKVPVAA